MYKISSIKIDGYTFYNAKPEKPQKQTEIQTTKKTAVKNNPNQMKQEYYEKLKKEYFSDKDFTKKCESIDKLYLEKCKEVNKLKEKIRELEETVKRHEMYEEYIEPFVELPFC